MSTPADLKTHVREALKLAGYSFDEAEIERISQQFARFAAIAADLDARPLPYASSAAPVFRP